MPAFRPFRLALALIAASLPMKVYADAAGEAARTLPTVEVTAQLREIEDLKSVLATVRSKKVIDARVRTPEPLPLSRSPRAISSRRVKFLAPSLIPRSPSG